MRAASALLMVAVGALAAGCEDFEADRENTNIVGRTTQNIVPLEQMQAQGNAQPANRQIGMDPVTYAPNTYIVAIDRIAQIQIDHAVNLFHATEGRYPESYEEFMQRIIHENGIRLPQLPPSQQYTYDAANHQLVIVDVTAEQGADARP